MPTFFNSLVRNIIVFRTKKKRYKDRTITYIEMMIGCVWRGKDYVKTQRRFAEIGYRS
jgi:hypothetical protein